MKPLLAATTQNKQKFSRRNVGDRGELLRDVGTHRTSMCSSTRKHAMMWGMRTPMVRSMCAKRHTIRGTFALCQNCVKAQDLCQNDAGGAPHAPRLPVKNLCQNMVHAGIPITFTNARCGITLLFWAVGKA